MIRLPRWPHAAYRLQPRWWAEETALAAQHTDCNRAGGRKKRLWQRRVLSAQYLAGRYRTVMLHGFGRVSEGMATIQVGRPRGGAAQVQCRCGPLSCTCRACAALDRLNAQLLCRARRRRLALPGSMPRQSRCSAALVERQSCAVLWQLGEFFSFLRDTKFFQHTKARPDPTE